MRLFVAADLPDDVRAAIGLKQKRMASAIAGDRTRGGEKRASTSRLKWVQPEHSHLTLVFLGDVSDARIAAVADAVGRDVDQSAFEITFEGIGVFPPRGAPRVLWVGVGDGAANLGDLQREMAQRIAALDIALERRPFHPHLTLARWRESRAADRGRALAAAQGGMIARACVRGATLYRSRLSSAGPTYTPLARARLNQPQSR